MNEKEEGDQEDVKMEECREAKVYMWGYLPGASLEKSPLLSPVPLLLPDSKWKDVCAGGCGFAMGISDSGKLITWGSADDEGQSYLTGNHGETPEAYHLPTEASVMKAAAGWGHCVSVTEKGEVYTWGWKECVPSGKIFCNFAKGGLKDPTGKQGLSPAEEGDSKVILKAQKAKRGKAFQFFRTDVIMVYNLAASPRPQGPTLTGTAESQLDNKGEEEEIIKKRKLSSAKQENESTISGDEVFTTSPIRVTTGLGVKITAVAAGGRHTLALSDMGQVWGWGYGGEGQLGLGSRVKMVASPHVIPCIEAAPASVKDRYSETIQGSNTTSAQVSKVHGDYVKEISCGGRHSAVVTDSGAVLTFGWGLYGQCGQGDTNDLLRPTCVPSLSDISVKRLAAGLCHTVCITVEGRIYVFGGNQFGQLGTGDDQAETLPRLLDAPSLDSTQAKLVSCGDRHSALLTEDGQLFSWGWNKYGQLGLGDSIDRTMPSKVALDGCLPRNVACGWWHTLMLADPSTDSSPEKCQ